MRELTAFLAVSLSVLDRADSRQSSAASAHSVLANRSSHGRLPAAQELRASYFIWQ